MSGNLADYLNAASIQLDIRAAGKKDLLRQMIEHQGNRLPSGKAAIKALLDREDLGSTGVGEGVAIPHGRIDLDGGQPVVAFARARDPLPFDAIDDIPVDLVFIILTDTAGNAAHLSLLGRISRLIRKADIRAQLRQANSVQEVLTLIAGADNGL